MFAWINKQGVRSDLGFEVQFTGRFDAEYREGSRVVNIYVEDGVGDHGEPCVIVKKDAFTYWNDREPIQPAVQELMFKNLRAAMEFQGLKLYVE